jgi:hypothetical protein
VISGESGRQQSALPGAFSGAFFWASSGLEFMPEFYPENTV